MSRRAAGRKAKEAGYQPLPLDKAPSEVAQPLAQLCLVFEADDKEGGPKADESMTRKIRQPIVDKLRSSDLIVHEKLVKPKDGKSKVYVTVSAAEKRMKPIADIMGLKLRIILKDIHSGHVKKRGGAWTPFQQHLAALYESSTEGSLFSSNQQLQILEYILSDEDERARGPKLVHKQTKDLGNNTLEQLVARGEIECYFRMHHKPRRDELLQKWALNWTGQQPIEEIREYFGEKIALYFVFLGFYIKMLWLPAACGLFVALSQLLSLHLTGSADNPWVPLYCCFVSVWSIATCFGWKRLEREYQYEWDTLDVEDTEEDRPAFIRNVNTHIRLIEHKGTFERYPEPVWRTAACAIAAAAVCACILLSAVAVASIAYARFRLLRLLEPLGMAGLVKLLAGVAQALSVMLLNFLYGFLLRRLTDMQNWKTETEYEDAAIAQDFSFKIVNAYFACFFVAFVQNNIKVFGEDLHCPLWDCMPELSMTLATIFVVQLTVQQALELGPPVVLRLAAHLSAAAAAAWRRLRGPPAAAAASIDAPPAEGRELEAGPGAGPGPGAEGGGEEAGEEAAQEGLAEFPGAMDEYAEMLVQLGYVTIFGAAFPVIAALALLNNLIELRVDAYKLLALCRRPPHKSAQDIGMFQSVMEVLTTLGIMTNCAVVGFVSHGLSFYFPDMTPTQRVWIVILCENGLLLFKAMLDGGLEDACGPAEKAYRLRCFARNKLLSEVDFLRPRGDKQLYTAENGDPYYGD